jgi:hypothetical protein
VPGAWLNSARSPRRVRVCRPRRSGPGIGSPTWCKGGRRRRPRWRPRESDWTGQAFANFYVSTSRADPAGRGVGQRHEGPPARAGRQPHHSTLAHRRASAGRGTDPVPGQIDAERRPRPQPRSPSAPCPRSDGRSGLVAVTERPLVVFKGCDGCWHGWVTMGHALKGQEPAAPSTGWLRPRSSPDRSPTASATS